MESNVIIMQLKSLKLPGMAEAAGDLLKLPTHMRPSLELALARLIEAEVRSRDDSRTARLLKAAKLKMKPLIEDVICSTARNLTKEQLTTLADCGFIRRGENLLLTGLTGTGKSFLANALGLQAIKLGLRVLYLSMNHFTDELRKAKLDGTFEDLLKRLDSKGEG